jgi:hypothetical protein
MRMPTRNHGLTREQLLTIALRAGACDLRTLRKYLNGEHVAAMTALAIRGAIAELGLRDPRTATTEPTPAPPAAANPGAASR